MILPTASPEEASRGALKSPAAFRTIAEVASELDLPAHVLRFWESKFSQLKPLKRRGGRRYYRPEDVALLRRIRSLLYSEGYTIKGVQRLLREGGGKPVEEPAKSASSSPERNHCVDPQAVSAPKPPSTNENLRALLAELQALRRLLHDQGI